MAKQKKGLFGSLFEVVEKDPIEKAKEAVMSNTPVRSSLTEMPISSSGTLSNSSLISGNRYTGKFDNVLDSIIEKENVPGPNVYELIQSVKEMMMNGFSEDQAYRSAFTAFKSMGLTKEKLIETSNYYLNVLSQVHNEFQTNVIGKNELEISNLDKRREELVTEINRLTEEVKSISNDRQVINDEMITAKQEMDGSQSKMCSFFNGIINKINTYL